MYIASKCTQVHPTVHDVGHDRTRSYGSGQDKLILPGRDKSILFWSRFGFVIFSGNFYMLEVRSPWRPPASSWGRPGEALDRRYSTSIIESMRYERKKYHRRESRLLTAK